MSTEIASRTDWFAVFSEGYKLGTIAIGAVKRVRCVAFELRPNVLSTDFGEGKLLPTACDEAERPKVA